MYISVCYSYLRLNTEQGTLELLGPVLWLTVRVHHLITTSINCPFTVINTIYLLVPPHTLAIITSLDQTTRTKTRVVYVAIGDV